MANQQRLTIERREGSGSQKARAVRKQGKVPGILYGHGGNADSIAIDSRSLSDLLHHGGRTSLIELELDGKKLDTALVREVQIDPVTRRAIHIDLQRVSANETVHTKLPLVMVGTPDGVRNFGGVMDVIVHEIEVEGPANKLPDHLDVNVENLGIHEHITASGIPLPKGFKLLGNAEAIVVTVEASKTAHALEEVEAGAAGEEIQPELVGKPEGEPEAS